MSEQVPVEVFFKLQLTGFVHRFAWEAHMVATHNRRPDQVLDERLEPLVALATAVWESVATTFGEEWCKADKGSVTYESGRQVPVPCEHWGWAHVDGYCVGCIGATPFSGEERIVDEQFRPQHAYSDEPDIGHEDVALFELRDAGLARGRKWLAEHPEVTKESDEDQWWFGFYDAAVTVVPTDDATLKRLALTEDSIWEAKVDQPGENVRDTVRLAIKQAIEVHAQKQLAGAHPPRTAPRE